MDARRARPRFLLTEKERKRDMGHRTPLIMLVLLALAPISAARADEIGELRELILLQTQQLQQLQQRLDELEAKQMQQSREVEQKISEAVELQQADALPENLKWVEKIKVSGDLRYRAEQIDQQTNNSSVKWEKGRHRHRIRGRLMLEAMVNDEWGAAFRLASGGGSDPFSTNQTLDEGFSSKDLWLDLAYFDWHPIALEGFRAYGGKMKNPFYAVGKNELIWDHDLNPEGLAAQQVIQLSEADQLFINGGGFWAEESSSGVDQSLWGIQAYIKHQIANPTYLLGGVSYYDFGHTKGQATLYDDEDGFGNTVTEEIEDVNTPYEATKTFYAYDYDLLEFFGEYGFECFGLPAAIFGSYVTNTASDVDEDTGWLIGGRLNKAKDPGSWELRYNYRDTEKDAVIGIFADSDFIGGGVGGRGHKFGFTYQLAKNLQAALTYFHTEIDRSPKLDYRRFQGDLKFKF